MPFVRKTMLVAVDSAWIAYFASSAYALIFKNGMFYPAIISFLLSFGILFRIYPRMVRKSFLQGFACTMCIPVAYFLFLLILYLFRLETARVALVTWVAAIMTLGVVYLLSGLFIATLLWLISKNEDYENL